VCLDAHNLSNGRLKSIGTDAHIPEKVHNFPLTDWLSNGVDYERYDFLLGRSYFIIFWARLLVAAGALMSGIIYLTHFDGPQLRLTVLEAFDI
jgi:hypothetical protein